MILQFKECIYGLFFGAQSIFFITGFVKRNIAIILAMLGAPLMTAVFATLLNSIGLCTNSAFCSEYRDSIALFLGLVFAFTAARRVHRAIHGVDP